MRRLRVDLDELASVFDNSSNEMNFQLDLETGIVIAKVGSRDAYRDMERFIVTVRMPGLQERQYRAISGRGAFRYIKDVLLDHPQERERWFAYEDERMRQRVFH